MKELTNKVVLITGGSKGIGRETAKLFAKHGATVIITGRRIEELQKTSKRLQQEYGVCDYIQGDVTKLEECKHVVDTVIDKYKRIDILINNAGMSMRGLFEETTLDLFQKMMDINFMGAVTMTKLVLPTIIEHKGSIVFISSLSGLKGIPGIAPYGTAKMALTGFTESLRAEVYAKDVHIGLVFVGFTENDQDKTIYSAKGERIPIHRSKNSDTQEHVAKQIVRVVQSRKAVVYLTFLGKVTKLFYQFFPRLSGYLLRKFALKSEMYKS